MIRSFQIQHDGFFRLTESGVQFGAAAGIAAAGASTLITSAPSPRDIAWRSGGNHPTEIQHPHAG